MKRLTILFAVVVLIAVLASGCAASQEAIDAAVAEALAAERASVAEDTQEAPAAVVSSDNWCADPFVIRTIDEGVAPIYRQKVNANGKLVFKGDKMVMVAIDNSKVIEYRLEGLDGEVFWGLGGETEVCVSDFSKVSSGNVFQLEGYKLPDRVTPLEGRERITMLGNVETRDIGFLIYVNATDIVGFDAPSPAEDADVVVLPHTAIQGKVLTVNNDGVPDITVWLVGTGRHAVTDENGAYIFYNVTPGDYSIKALGYTMVVVSTERGKTADAPDLVP